MLTKSKDKSPRFSNVFISENSTLRFVIEIRVTPWIECSLEDVVNKASTFSPNGLPFTKFNTVDTCLTACASYFDNCVAVDMSIDNGHFICWIHTNVSDLDTVYRWKNVSQSRFTSCTYRGKFREPNPISVIGYTFKVRWQ